LLLRFFEQFSDPRWTPSVLDSKVKDRINNQRNTGKVTIKRSSSLGRFYASSASIPDENKQLYKFRYNTGGGRGVA
jgi:hypothetical protein